MAVFSIYWGAEVVNVMKSVVPKVLVNLPCWRYLQGRLPGGSAAALGLSRKEEMPFSCLEQKELSWFHSAGLINATE